MEETYHFITYNIDTHFHKDPADKDKYIVCTCARGENDYIVEYVEHYLNLDFDKILSALYLLLADLPSGSLI